MDPLPTVTLGKSRGECNASVVVEQYFCKISMYLCSILALCVNIIAGVVFCLLVSGCFKS